jgi:hypothetical protein
MEINQNLVELVNARVKDLAVEVQMLNAFEFAEELELPVKEANSVLLEKLTAKFELDEPLEDFEDANEALETFKTKIEESLQLDRIRSILLKNGLSFEAAKEIVSLRDDSLNHIIKVLEITKEELEG